MSKLKPCPFCGRAPQLQNEKYATYDNRGSTKTSFWTVKCLWCWHGDINVHETREDAITAWNRRKEKD